MHRNADKHRAIGAAERGHLIQRILVDGWTSAEAAQLIGVDERQVRRWLADYRRRGMASLRGDLTGKTSRRWLGWMCIWVARLRAIARRETGTTASAPCVVLRSSNDDNRRQQL
jgi:hypothetical protein